MQVYNTAFIRVEPRAKIVLISDIYNIQGMNGEDYDETGWCYDTFGKKIWRKCYRNDKGQATRNYRAMLINIQVGCGQDVDNVWTIIGNSPRMCEIRPYFRDIYTFDCGQRPLFCRDRINGVSLQKRNYILRGKEQERTDIYHGAKLYKTK